MTARIVMDAGGGPVVGSIVLPATEVGTPVGLSNADNTQVEGWRWEILDAPAPSPTLNPLPAPTFANTAVIANDVKGHTVMLRLTTYKDAGRTQIDDVDQQVIGVRYDPPFDWVIPAAQQSIEANEIRGWAQDVNRILRDVHTIIEVGTDSDWKQSARALVDGDALAAHTRTDNVVTADGNGALPVQDGVTLVVNDAIVLDYAAPNVDAGVYIVTALGDGSNPFVFTRRIDFDEDTEVTPGLRIGVEEGTVSGGQIASLTTVGAIIVNTTALNFELQLGAVHNHDHDLLINFVTGQHRVINDGGTSATELWSASKINAEVVAILAGIDIKPGAATSTAGLGNVTLSGEQTLNGVLTAASRVLVTDQTDPIENGIYVTAAGAWARAADADEDAEVTNGNVVHILDSGSTKFKYKYLLVTPDPIVVDTTAQTWEEHPDDGGLDGEVLTNDATPVNIGQFTPADDQAFTIWGAVTAFEGSDGAHWLFMLSGQRVSGVITVAEFKILNQVIDLDLVGADFNIDVTGVLRFRATGLAATSIQWRLKTFNFDSGAPV